MIFTLIFHGVPEKGGDVLLTMLGALGMLVKDVYSFDFGSSKGSEKKDDAMLAAAAKAQDAPSPAPPTPAPPAPTQ